jgi:small subunit ribosomal protein S16
LTRKGAKKQPFYRIVVADSRFPRDGRFIESIGIYDPKTDPSTIEVDKTKASEWLNKGAIPTGTVKKIFEIVNLKKENTK